MNKDFIDCCSGYMESETIRFREYLHTEVEKREEMFKKRTLRKQKNVSNHTETGSEKSI